MSKRERSREHKGGGPRMEAAPVSHEEEASPMDSPPMDAVLAVDSTPPVAAVERYRVADHLDEGHLLRLRFGGEAHTADEFSRRWKVRGNRLGRLVAMGALVKV